MAAGAAALAAPTAQASTPTDDTGKLSVLRTIDGIARDGMPEDQARQLPTVESQLRGIEQLNQLNQLNQITGLVAPLTNLVPGIQ